MSSFFSENKIIHSYKPLLSYFVLMSAFCFNSKCQLQRKALSRNNNVHVTGFQAVKTVCESYYFKMLDHDAQNVSADEVSLCRR